MRTKPTPPSKPWAQEPKKVITPRREVARTQIYDSDELKVEAGKRYYFDYDYSGDDREYYLVEFTQVEETNPNYEAELKAYNRIQEKYKADLADYEAQVKLWESAEGQRKLALFNTLKKELGL
jgi:hypothetical protein